LDDEASGLLAYSIRSGALDDAELNAVWKRFDDAASGGTKIRIYAEMSGFPSINASVLMDKLKRLGTIMSTTERMAIVGDAGWMDVYVTLMDPITKPDLKHFSTSEREEALAWLRS
jgi:hypothetical protein